MEIEQKCRLKSNIKNTCNKLTKIMQLFQAKCLVWEVLGLRFCIFFAYFLNVFFMLLSRWTFCAILADSGLQRESLWESIFADFANFACKNDMLDLKHENEAFLALIWRGRRQWGGLPESSDSAENGEWFQSRTAPPAGVRRILWATPSAAGTRSLLIAPGLQILGTAASGS